MRILNPDFYDLVWIPLFCTEPHVAGRYLAARACYIVLGHDYRTIVHDNALFSWIFIEK